MAPLNRLKEAYEVGLGRRSRSGFVSSRLAQLFPQYFADRLHNPIFVVGFNNSGKSTFVAELAKHPQISVFPGEGNAELWFSGFYPWTELDLEIPPLWSAPDLFVRTVMENRVDGFETARALLGAHQWVTRRDRILNDSGMLAALLPELRESFADFRVVHVIRDGRVVSYLAARKHWERMQRQPEKYQRFGCPSKFHEILRRLGQYWDWTLRRVESIEASVPGSVFSLRYEDWCTNPDAGLAHVLEFLECADWSHRARTGITNMNDQTLSEMTTGERVILEETIGDRLRQHHYL